MIQYLILLVPLFFISATLFSQSKQPYDLEKVYEKVVQSRLNSSRAIQTIDDLFIPNTSSSIKKNKSIVSSAEFFELNIDAIYSIQQKNNTAITLSIPFILNKSTELLLDVYSVSDLRFPQTKTSSKTSMHFRGVVRGYEQTSIVALSIFDNEVMGIASIRGSGNYQIGKMRGEDYHVIYNDKDLNEFKGIHCNSDELINSFPTDKSQYLKSQSQNIEDVSYISIGIYFVVDYDMYEYFDYDEIATENFVEGLFNQVSTIYANEGITLRISDIKIIKTGDIYDTNPLYDFMGDYPAFDGDLAHLLSYQSAIHNGGGFAFVSALCYFSYGESRLSADYEDYPLYSNDLFILTHELGHNLGSPHTNKCSWNDNNTQLDDCGNVISTTNGRDDDFDGIVDELDEAEGVVCFNPQSPILPAANQGTIMSNCHLIQEIGTDFTLGFGPQPGDMIRQHIFNSVDCLSEPFLRGDANLDGAVNILDAYLTSKFSVGLAEEVPCHPPLSNNEICFYSADVDCDNSIIILDAYNIARLTVGLPINDCPQ